MSSTKVAPGPLMERVPDQDLLEALVDVVIPCDAGHRSTDGIPPCGDDAVWAAKTHELPSRGACPRVRLLCDGHLRMLHLKQAREWRLLDRLPLPVICGNCGSSIEGVQDLIWNVERITR